MSLPLTKLSETASTITLGWTPPSDAQAYVFYADGSRVTNGTPYYLQGPRKGQARDRVEYAKGGEPYEVACLCRNSQGVFRVEFGVYPEEAPPAWTTPLVITRGGTYENGAYESTSAAWNSGAIEVRTTEPVLIRNCHVKNVAGGSLIYVAISGADVTVERVRAFGGDTWQTSGRFIENEQTGSLVVRNCTIENTGGIDCSLGTPGGHVLVERNRHHNIQGYIEPKSQGGGIVRVGNFVQVRVMNATKTVEIAWNEIVNEYDKSFPEDVISIYSTSGAHVHDNYIQHQSRPGNDYDESSQGSITIEGHGGAISNVLCENNQVVDAYGIILWPYGGSNNRLLGNRIVNDGYLPNGEKTQNGWGSPLGVKSPGANNHAHGNVVGYVDRDGNRFPIASNLEGAAEGADAEAANNVFMPDPITAASEAAEWQRWQDKLASNGITIGAG